MRGQEGYVLIVLLLMVALIAIAMGAAVTNYKKAIQRDREVEAIHRGVQYARAIKAYYKKFGRFPNSIDQLTNTNNLRFLRKKYSDPLSPDGKWRVLHQQDVKGLGAAGGLGGGGMPYIPGVSGNGSQNALLGSGQQQPGGQSGFNLFGSSGSQGNAADTASASKGGPGSTSQPIGGAIETTGGKDESSSGSAFSTPAVLNSGPIVGVSSLRDENGIHSFNQKTNYRDWQFIFNPSTDVNRLITGPFNPNALVGKGGAGLPPSDMKQGGSDSNFNSATPSQPQQQPAPPSNMMSPGSQPQ